MAASISNTPATINVYINGVLSSNLQVLMVERFTGGRQLDRATLELTTTSQLENTTLGNQAQIGAACKIVVVSGGVSTAIHAGVIHQIEARISGEEHGTLFTSAFKPWHFELQTQGMLERNPASGQDEWNNHPIVFNPRLDGRLLPNKAANGLRFIDPEAVRTQPAQNYHGTTAVFWTLATAVEWLGANLNKQELFVFNASVPNLQTFANGEILRDVRLPHGLYLPEALDRLLEPLGYSWFIDHPSFLSKPRITVYRRGALVNAGAVPRAPQVVYLAPTGTNISNTSNDAYDIDMAWDSSAAVNQVFVYGDFHRREATFELIPAWAPSDDALPTASLAEDSPQLVTRPDLARVWREWVLNEGGDYIGLRPSFTAPYDLAGKFGYPVIVKRRRFLPSVTLRPDKTAPAGEIGGCLVEYSVDGGATWKPVEENVGNVQILDHECGIRFDSLMVPVIMKAAGYPQAKVRVTASIESDVKLQVQSIGAGGPLKAGEFSRQLIDLGDALVWRDAHPQSELVKRIATLPPALKDGAQKDTSQATALAITLTDNWNLARFNGRIKIDGIPSREGTLFLVGDLVTGIDYRAISFALTPGVSPKYPQVTAVRYDWQEQTQTILLESHHSPGEGEQFDRELDVNAFNKLIREKPLFS